MDATRGEAPWQLVPGCFARAVPPRTTNCKVGRRPLAFLWHEHEGRGAGLVGVTHLGVVESGHAEEVGLQEIIELNVELRAGGELATELERPGAVRPVPSGGEVAAVADDGCHDDSGDYVAGLEAGRVEGDFLRVKDESRAAVGRGTGGQHERRQGLVFVLVVDVPAAVLGVAMAAGFGRVGRVAGGVEVLVVELIDVPDRLPVPDVAELTLLSGVLVAEG